MSTTTHISAVEWVHKGVHKELDILHQDQANVMLAFGPVHTEYLCLHLQLRLRIGAIAFCGAIHIKSHKDQNKQSQVKTQVLSVNRP